MTEITVTDAAPAPAVSPAAATLLASMERQIRERIAAAEAKGNDTLARKWRVELQALTSPAYAEALAEARFDPDKLGRLAIYATQKVRRLVGAFLGVGRVDPYTETILRNAKALQGEAGNTPTASRLLTAALSKRIRTTETLPIRREASEGTASTQASSTRQALIALGAGRMEGKGKDATFVVDFSHPFIARVLGAA